MKRIYLDSCIIIYLIEKHPIYANQIEISMNSELSAEFCYSPLTRLECFVMPFRNKDIPLQKLYEAFFSTQKILSVSSDIFDEAAKLRADLASLKTPDALHLAIAVYHKCDEFWTNDNRLDKIIPDLVKNILTV